MKRRKHPILVPGWIAMAILAAWFTTGSFPEMPAARGQATTPRFQEEIGAFARSDRTNPPPQGAILFIGSSSIRLWKTLAEDFPGRQVINRGFGGSQLIDSVNYAERIVLPYQPKRIVLYAGGNDINEGKSPQQVLADYRAFVAKVQAALPATRIAYISIAPNPARWAQVDKVREANRLIEDYARQHPQLSFINVFTRMLGTDELPQPDLFGPDRLHMSPKGYALWKELVGPFLESEMSNEQ